MATTFDAQPGESCSNDRWDNKFTCPNCYTDHAIQGSEQPTYIKCESCAADLRCQLELITSSLCTIAYPDELEDAA